MAKHNWMRMKIFQELHNVSATHISVMKRTGSIPGSAFKSCGSRKCVLIDELFFLRRHEFREKIIKANQEKYYELNDTQIVPRIADALVEEMNTTITALRYWLYSSMWAPPSGSILNYKISKLHYYFYRATRRKSTV